MSFDFQAAYEELNPADGDYRFYVALAVSAGVSRAADLGCGTGTLARMLASGEASVVGVDPDPEMLRVARSKDPEGRVDWRLGYLTLRTVQTPEGTVEFWHQAAVVDLSRVSYNTLTRNLRTGEASTSRDILAFRDGRTLQASLELTGFEVDAVYGDWDQTAPAATSPELIVIARKPS